MSGFILKAFRAVAAFAALLSLLGIVLVLIGATATWQANIPRFAVWPFDVRQLYPFLLLGVPWITLLLSGILYAAVDIALRSRDRSPDPN